MSPAFTFVQLFLVFTNSPGGCLTRKGLNAPICVQVSWELCLFAGCCCCRFFYYFIFFKQLHSVAKTSTVGAVVSSEQQLRDIILL